jgi:hypothetical protein
MDLFDLVDYDLTRPTAKLQFMLLILLGREGLMLFLGFK